MLKKDIALKIVLGISVAGLLFSGYLSYTELFRRVCAFGGCSVLGNIPVCVYGFFMYLIVFIVSLLGLMSEKK